MVFKKRRGGGGGVGGGVGGGRSPPFANKMIPYCKHGDDS